VSYLPFYLCYDVVRCASLSDPSNGTIICSFGNDGVPSYEDTCSYTCNTGYELTGSDTRTCQSNGNWSESDIGCVIGMLHIYLFSLAIQVGITMTKC